MPSVLLTSLFVVIIICSALILWAGIHFYRHNRLLPLPEQTTYRCGSTLIAPGKKIPKIVWTYWHNAELPLVVERCIQGWRKLNPEYTVHVLHADNLGDFIDDIPATLSQLNVAKQTDWIRLELLHKYGGIWLDSSTILTQPLNWVESERQSNGAEFVGYYIDGFTTNKSFPVVESWFLAAPAGSRFIADWLHVFRKEVIEGGTENYLNALQTGGRYKAVTQAIGDPAYHTIHVAAQDIIQQHSATNSPYNLFLMKAEDSAFWLQVQAKWKRRPLYVRLLASTTGGIPALIKLRGGERRKLEAYLKHGIFRKGSIAERYLGAASKAAPQNQSITTYSRSTQN